MSLARVAMNFSRNLRAISALGMCGQQNVKILVPTAKNLSRNLSTSGHLSSHAHKDGGVSWENLPFKYKGTVRMTLTYIFFFGVGLWAPFWIVQYSILKKQV